MHKCVVHSNESACRKSGCLGLDQVFKFQTFLVLSHIICIGDLNIWSTWLPPYFGLSSSTIYHCMYLRRVDCTHLFIPKRCHHFEGTRRNLWSVLVPSNALKVLPSVTYERGSFLSKKKLDFWVTAAIKQQQRLIIMTNPTMVCSYHYYCLDLPVALVDYQVAGCPSLLYYVC